MSAETTELLAAVREIRELLGVMAEPAIAQRDRKARDEIRRLVGKSALKSKAVELFNGARTRAVIVSESGIDSSDLSKLIKVLASAGVMDAESAQPKLLISLPRGFFDEREV